MPWLYRASQVLLTPPVRWFWMLRVFGAENVPATGPVLLASNHTSYVDPWFLGGVFPRGPIRFLINDSWFERSRGWRFVFEANGVIPAVTGDPIETVRRVTAALAEGAVVGVFPEGRISRDGRMSRGRLGVGWMAAASGAPVVPCAVRGAFDSIPRHKRLPRRRPVHVHIGEPIRFPGAPVARPDSSEVQKFMGDLMRTIRTLAGHEDALPESALPLDAGEISR